MTRAVVHLATTAFEAEAVAARLSARGIEALAGTSSGLDVAMPGRAPSPVAVTVAAADESAARAVLAEPVEAESESSPLTRPRMPWLARVAFVVAAGVLLLSVIGAIVVLVT